MRSETGRSCSARRKKQVILFATRYRLPSGIIRLSSLEAMETGDWAGEELTTTR